MKMRKLLAPIGVMVLLGLCMPAEGMRARKKLEKKLKAQAEEAKNYISLKQTLTDLHKEMTSDELRRFIAGLYQEADKAKAKPTKGFVDKLAKEIDAAGRARGQELIDRIELIHDHNTSVPPSPQTMRKMGMLNTTIAREIGQLKKSAALPADIAATINSLLGELNEAADDDWYWWK